MPTPEEIKKIATAYFTSKEAEGTYSEIERAFQWLCKDYCIVPKRHIQMRHASCCALAETDPARKDMYMCQRRVLETIFGTELFKEEKP